MLGPRSRASLRGRDIAAVLATQESEGAAPHPIHLYLALLSHLFTVTRKRWGMEGRTPRLYGKWRSPVLSTSFESGPRGPSYEPSLSVALIVLSPRAAPCTRVLSPPLGAALLLSGAR